MKTRKGHRSFKKRSKRGGSNRKSRNLRRRFSKRKGGRKYVEDYKMVFDFPKIGLGEEPQSLDLMPKGPITSFIANKPITDMDRSDEDNNSLKRRKYYEMRIWDETRYFVKLHFNRDKLNIIIPILQKFIRDFLITTTKSNNRSSFFLDKFKDTFNNKLKFYLTGIIDYEGFVSDLKKLFGENTAPANTSTEYKILQTSVLTIVQSYCSNVRLCLTTIDFLLKTLEGINKPIMGYLIESFDNCVRHRDSIANEELDEYLPNKFCIKDFTDNQVCTGDSCIPHETGDNKDNCTSLTSDEGLIEPYDSNENSQLTKVFQGKKFPFASGVNSFYLNKPQDTIDVFAAGISGHTAEIGLMFRLFTSDFFGSDQQRDFMPQHFIAQACLIWMADFYHHSLREILLASCIHFPYSPDTINQIEKLYSPLTTSGVTLDKILREGGIIDESIKSVSKLRKPTTGTFDENVLLNILNSAPQLDPAVKEKINLCYNNIKQFETKIPPTLKEKIVWPTEENCIEGGPNKKLLPLKDNNAKFYGDNGLFGYPLPAATTPASSV